MAIDTFERLVLDRLCGTLLTPARRDRAAAALPTLAGRVEQLRAVLNRHKGYTYFADSLARLAGEPQAAELAGHFATELAARRAHYDLLTAELEWLRAAGSAVSGCVTIKGFSTARFYPDPEARWSRDIDLFVPSWDQTLHVVELLRGRGYEFDPGECPWIKAEPARGRAEYGQVFLIRPVGDGYARVDIHFGTYSAGSGEYLRPALTDFYEPGAEPRLDATGTLLVMFAHALSDGYVSVKDANDCVAMATASAEVAWPTLRTEIHRHSFGPQAALLARYLTEQHDDPAVTEFAARLGEAAACRGPTLWQMHNRNWVRRAAINADYTLRAALRQRRGLLTALTRAAQCFAFYVRRLDVGVRRRSLREWLLLQFMPTSDLLRWQLRSDSCPTLVHVDHPALAGALDSPKIPQRLRPTPLPGVWVGDRLVLMGSDLFLCTWDQLIDPGQLDEVRRLTAEPA